MNRRPDTARTWRVCWSLLIAALLLVALHGGRSARIPDAASVAAIAQPDDAAALLVLHPPTQSANEVEPIAGPPVPGAKDRVDESGAVVRSGARAVRTAGLRLMAEARRAPLALRRAALLFPFHFFW